MAGDALYNNVSLLLHCDGSNGSTTFTDNSPTPKTVTAVSGAKITTADSVFGGASGVFNGTSDYCTLSSAPSLNSGDFTIEGWFKPTGAAGGGVLIANRNTSGTYGYIVSLSYSGGKWNWFWQFWNPSYADSGASFSGVTASSSVFTFCQLTRVGNALTGYVGGASCGTFTSGSRPVASATAPTLFRDSGAAQGWWGGKVDDLRITTGGSRATTLPTEAFPDRAPQVSGNVKDSAGANAARTVRAYRRDTGALVGSTTSNGTTGNYTINCTTLEEVTVVALDNATSGTYYNDQAVRVIPD